MLTTTRTLIWKIPLCGIAYAITFVISASLLSPLAPEALPQPDEAEAPWMLLRLLAVGLLVACGLAAIGPGIQGSWLSRSATLSAFLYVTNSVSGTIEAHFFTTLAEALTFFMLIALAPSILGAALTALLLVPGERGYPFITNLGRFLRSRTVAAWIWRLPLAVLAFPVIYTTFGLLVHPFVIDFYREQDYLRIPGPGLLLAIQLLRGLLFVIVVVPIFILWSGSKLRLWLALSLALFLFVGLTGLIQGIFTARVAIAHGVEILADSLVHAGVLVLLLARKNPP